MSDGTRLSFQKTADGFPILKTAAGHTIALKQCDIDMITELVATGHSPDFCAYRLGVSTKEFERARANCELIQDALRVGLARDEKEITDEIRKQAKAGSMVAAIHYTKHKLGWQSADSKNAIEKSKPTVLIQINTGIERGETTVQTSIIEGNKDESLF